MAAKKLHKSWWLVAAAVGVVFGVGLAYFSSLRSSWPILVLIVGLLFFLGLIFSKSRWSLIFILLIGLLIGWSRASITRRGVLVYDYLQNQVVSLSGELYDDVSRSATSLRVLRLNKIQLDSNPVPGQILASSRFDIAAKRGDQVWLTGKLKPRLGGYQATLTVQKVNKVEAVHSQGLLLRDFFANNLSNRLTDLQANLASAFLVGKRRELPADFNLALQIVGLSHLVVASGFHLTTVVRAAKRSFGIWSRRAALIGGLAAIFVFAAVTGLSASMWRASLVGLLSLLAWFYGRSFAPWRLLLLVLAAVIMINPLFLWGDAAFYLSFSAFAGVMIVGPILRQYFWGQSKLGFVKQLLTEAVAVQLIAWPLSVLFFGRLSLVMIFTNLLVVPVAAPLMALAFAVSLLGGIPLVGTALVWLLQLVLNYVIAVVNWFSLLPFASIELEISWPWLVGYYLIGSVALVYIAWRNHLDQAVMDFNVIE